MSQIAGKGEQAARKKGRDKSGGKYLDSGEMLGKITGNRGGTGVGKTVLIAGKGEGKYKERHRRTRVWGKYWDDMGKESYNSENKGEDRSVGKVLG